MKIIDEIILYENPDPLLVSKQGIFPGIVKLQDNSLLALFTIGQAFDSADQRTFVSKSFDDGRSWSEPKPLHNHIYKNIACISWILINSSNHIFHFYHIYIII